MSMVRPPHSDERGILLDIWEWSVRAAHAFLSVGDIGFYRPMVKELPGSPMEFRTAFREGSNTPLGFMGLDKDGEGANAGEGKRTIPGLRAYGSPFPDHRWRELFRAG